MKLRQRVRALLLSLCLMSCLLPPGSAAGEVKTSPPAWCPAEEYAAFEGSKAYEPDTWAKIEALRADAAAGELRPTSAGRGAGLAADFSLLYKSRDDPGICFELALIDMKYELNTGTESRSSRVQDLFEKVKDLTAETGGRPHQIAELWYARAVACYWAVEGGVGTVDRVLRTYGYTAEQFFDSDIFLYEGEEKMAELRAGLKRYQETIKVELDGSPIHIRTTYPDRPAAHVRNGRTMVPLRTLAEAIGSDVEWEQESRRITIRRAADRIVMTLDSPSAAVNGQTLQMDAAPYAIDGTTYIPVRYVAEFFGQKVEWDQGEMTVRVTEDREAAAPSNLEHWALPMGAMLNFMNSGVGSSESALKTRLNNAAPTLFGGAPRRTNPNGLPGYYDACTRGRGTLNGASWGIESREDLIRTVTSMTSHGHNDAFLEAAGVIKALTAAEFSSLVAESTGVDRFMWPHTKTLSDKWGDRGILCWDLFRMSNLVQWGYGGGYLTYPEALALLEPAARLLRENFTSWDEAYENYLDGYNWWARSDLKGQEVWETERGIWYRQMKESEAIGSIFDDGLFAAGVVPVPGLSAGDLNGEVS